MAAKATTPMPKPTPVRPVPPALNSPERRAAPPVPPPGPKPLPRWRHGFRLATGWLYLIVLGCVVMQIALAGAGLMGDDSYWVMGESEFLKVHSFFFIFVELFALIAGIVGFLGADKQAGIFGIAMVVLIELQHLFVSLDGVARSFHVLNALIIFTVALLMTLSRIPWRPHFLDAPPTPPKA